MVLEPLLPQPTIQRATVKECLSPLVSVTSGGFLRSGTAEIPWFFLKGSQGGGDSIRIAFFAGIHGDEPAGVFALREFILWLEANRDQAQGYELYFYPICNPWGFETGNRHSRNALDLNREFWTGSSEPEVQLLEAEIRHRRFHGLISLHSDDDSKGVYGFVRGAVLTRWLLEPALAAAEKALPRNAETLIDGFPAENGIISKCYDGILTAPPDLDPSPFEIIIETPGKLPIEDQVRAFRLAMETVLQEYPKLLAFAPNL